jgi:hypothetical protein
MLLIRLRAGPTGKIRETLQQIGSIPPELSDLWSCSCSALEAGFGPSIMPIIERTIKKMNPGYVGINGERIGLLLPPAGGTESQMLFFARYGIRMDHR